MTRDKGILIRNIYYMLSYAFRELRQNNFETIAGEQFDGIHDLFAEILFRGVSYRLKQGLLRCYVERTDTLPTLRGKLDIQGTMALRAAGITRLSCSYDEYSEDNIFNRILKSTIQLLLRHHGVKAERRTALRRLMPFFGNVGLTDLRLVRWDMLRFDRNNLSYRMLMYLCYFIAENMLLTSDAGEYRMHTFSDDHLCRLYEHFVLEYYRRHHPEYNASARQISWQVVKEETTMSMLPILQTDIYLTYGKKTLIIDTKYYGKTMQTHYDKRSIHSNNQNQILTYVLNHDIGHTGLTDGMLLYARTDEEFQPDGQMKWHDGNTIFYRTLDLGQPFDKIKQQLDELALLSFGQ